MSSRIRILSEQLANMIAAGEVVERPVSVVKELVENAIDAGARRIGVEIEGGGKRLIRVSDDGCGMTEDDLLLSVERHATSKIASPEDLFALSTLGFRGEALPSIASVSRMYLRSRRHEEPSGRELYLEGGAVRHLREHGMAPGTVVEVRTLFFNTPARLKFMKSNETEGGHVADLVSRLSLAFPEVRFTLTIDGRESVKALDPTLPGRIAEVLGKGISSELHPFESRSPGLTIHGFLAPPSVSRSTPGSILTFVNRRYVRDKVVQHAVLSPFRTTLEKGRYPVVVIFIDISPDEVDVNVHPTKHEVRFREQGMVHDAIGDAVSQGLSRILSLSVPSTPFLPTPHRSPESDRLSSVAERLERYGHRIPAVLPRPALSAHHGGTRDETKGTTHAEPAVGDESGVPLSGGREIIGQFLGMYILCRDGDDLLIIDQHAAHERVRFERLRKEFAGGSLERQGLLIPLTIELTHHQSALVKEHEALLDLLGFTIEPFGAGGWVISEIPRILEGVDSVRLFVDIMDELEVIGRSAAAEDAVDSLLMKMACHSVVRGVHPLSMAEMDALLAAMSETERAGHCPHGRPVVARLSRRDIERLFRR